MLFDGFLSWGFKSRQLLFQTACSVINQLTLTRYFISFYPNPWLILSYLDAAKLVLERIVDVRMRCNSVRFDEMGRKCIEMGRIRT